jgi:hypothetical protein
LCKKNKITPYAKDGYFSITRTQLFIGAQLLLCITMNTAIVGLLYAMVKNDEFGEGVEGDRDTKLICNDRPPST